MNYRILRAASVSLVLFFFVAAQGFCQAPGTDNRIPVPSKEQRDKKRDEVHSIFEIAKATKPSDKQRLAKQILSIAGETKDDDVAKFVMINIARELGQSSGDIAITMSAIDKISSDYQFDGLKLKLTALQTCSKASGMNTSRRGAILAEGKKLLDGLVSKDRFTHAAATARVMAPVAKSLRDPKLSSEYAERVLALEAIAKEHAIYTKALQVLKFDPDQAAANETVGKYLAFRKGDWNGALEHWHKCSNAQLAALAQMELDAATTAQRLALVDEWIKVGQTWPEAREKGIVLARAASHLREVLPQLAGLDKIKYKKRLEELGGLASSQPMNGQPMKPAPGVEATNTVVTAGSFLGVPILNQGVRDLRWSSGGEEFDLLKLVDLQRDQLFSSWVRQGTSIISPAIEHARVRVPVIPTAQYDVALEFRTDSSSEVDLTLSTPLGNRFTVLIDGHSGQNSGIRFVDGVDISEPQETRYLGRTLKPNATNTLKVAVRYGGIRISVNGKVISKYQGDFTRLTGSGHWEEADRSAIVIGAYKSRVTFTSAKLTTYEPGRLTSLRWPEPKHAPSSWYRRVLGRLPARAIQARRVFLDDLPETSFDVGHGVLGKNGASGIPERRYVRIDGKAYSHALATHPAQNGNGRVTYRLDDKFTKFTAGATILTSRIKSGRKIKGTLDFEVWGDGKPLKTKPGMKTVGKPQPITADITGVDSLVLVIHCNGTAAQAWGAWLNPTVER